MQKETEKKYVISLKLFFAIILVGIMLVANILTIIILGNIFQSKLLSSYEKETKNHVQTLADLISPIDMSNQFTEAQQKIFNIFTNQEDIRFARVFDLNTGKMVQSSFNDELLNANVGNLPQFTKELAVRDGIWNKILPINEYSLRLGDSHGLWVGINKTSIQSDMYSTMFLAFFLTIFLSALAFFIMTKLSLRMLLNPLDYMVRQIFEFKNGNLNVEISSETIIAEVNDLGIALNEMKNEFKKTRERDQSISNLKTEFVTIAAHQLRTPLTGVKWTANMMQEELSGKLNDEQKEYMSGMITGINQMMLLVNDLLKVAENEEGKFNMIIKDENMSSVVNEVIKEVDILAKTKNIKIILKSTKENVPPIKMDKEKVKWAVNNILSNAVEYSHENSSIDIGLDLYKNKYLMVTVKDYGIGIPKENYDKVFSRFFRAENAVKMHTEGSGLGLFVSQNIIKAHGGKIWFESEIDKGTTFYFILPVQIPEKLGEVEQFLTGL